MKLTCKPEDLENLSKNLEAQLGDAFLRFENKDQTKGTVELVLDPSASKYAHEVLSCSGFQY